MKEMVLDIIASYENRILAVEEWMSNTYRVEVASDDSVGTLNEERGKLTGRLQEILAQNCSLRRKDFNCVMQNILADSEQKRRRIEEERKQVIEKIKGYLCEQKELAGSLRRQLVEIVPEKTDKGSLNTLIDNIKATCKDTGQHLIAMLRDFQSNLAAFQGEQEEINEKLRRLVDRGESLTIEDLRHLQSAKARRDRKAERDSRRQEVEQLLAHLKQHRENSQHWLLVENLIKERRTQMAIASEMKRLTHDIASSRKDRAQKVAGIKGETKDLLNGFQASRQELKAELREASAAWQGFTAAKAKTK